MDGYTPIATFMNAVCAREVAAFMREKFKIEVKIEKIRRLSSPLYNVRALNPTTRMLDYMEGYVRGRYAP